MRVILHRGGNYEPRSGGSQRFEASPDPQDVPDKFGRAMVARGFADKAPGGSRIPDPEPLVDLVEDIVEAAAEEAE